jgi:hypothetical protein
MAQEVNRSVTAVEYCQRLRCKEMFVDMGEPFDLKDSGSGIYWCSRTQTSLGPDGQFAHVEQCRAGRGCYEAP